MTLSSDNPGFRENQGLTEVGEHFAFEQDKDNLRLVIRSRPPARGFVFLLVWLAGWLAFLVWAGNWLFQSGRNMSPFEIGFIILWLIAWTLGGGFALLYLAFILFGIEVLTIDARLVRIERRVLFLRRAATYHRNQCKDLRTLVPDAKYAEHPNIMYSRVAGPVAFRVDGNIALIRFGAPLSMSEAELVHRFLIKVCPDLTSTQ